MIPKKNFKFITALLILNLYEVFCEEKSSLTFVIDDTGSMRTVINQVTTGANSIFDAVLQSKESQIEDFVLVTFNDPDFPSKNRYASDLKSKTKDRTVFKNALSAITPDGGGEYDCPEYAMAGIMQGIRESRPRSSIYIFTDASAKDYDKNEMVKNLALEKQSKLIFVLTGNCGNKSEPGYKVYQQLADSTSGEAIYIPPKDVKYMIDNMITDIKGSTTDLFDQKLAYGKNKFSFRLDNENTHPKITVIGDNPTLTITGPDGRTAEIRTIMNLTTILVEEIVNSAQGVYIATMGCQSECRVKVTAGTQVMFSHGFSTENVKSIDYTAKRPLPDKSSYIYIKVTKGNINLQTLSIIDNKQGKVPTNIPLHIINGQENIYVTDLLQDLPDKFKLAITGIDPITLENITRIGSLIEKELHPEVFVQKAPVVVIEEVPKNTYSYGDTAEFTCKIEGYPLPNATWSFRNLANKHNIQDTVLNLHEKRSKIKLQKLKRSDQYSCLAVNAVGTATRSVNITVLSPFVVHQHPEATTDAHYRTMKNIVCNITSAFPMRIKWFHQINGSTTQIQGGKNASHIISSDETRLTINSVDFDTVGNYTCEASLMDDENETIAFTTDVQIDDLAPPLLSDSTKVTVMEMQLITLHCKIAGGVPRPTLSWFMKRHGEVEFTELPALSEDLDIENFTISKAGHYRCIAKNPIGQTYQNTEVLVRKAPVTNIEEGSTISVPYGSNNTFTFTCNVVAYPPPTITWEASSDEPSSYNKDEIKHEHLTSSKFTVEGIKADNTYSCRAKNPLGESTSKIQVKVLPLFVVDEHPSDKTYVHYLASKSLICKITTSLPMRIKWFHNGNEIHSSADYTISSDETKLDIRSTDLGQRGKYTCEAYLVNDVHVNKAYSTDLQIDDLQAPIITAVTGGGATVTYRNFWPLLLTCQATGNPKPVITWQLWTPRDMINGANRQINGDTVQSPRIGYAHAGTYTCVATNIVGTASKPVNVNIV